MVFAIWWQALNDEDNENVQIEKPRIIDIDGLMTMTINVLDRNDISHICTHGKIIISITRCNARDHQWLQRWWNPTMWPCHIIIENCCIKYPKQLTYLSQWITHPIMFFHCVDDGTGNLINQMKDWHESMFKHTTCRMRDCE